MSTVLLHYGVPKIFVFREFLDGLDINKHETNYDLIYFTSVLYPMCIKQLKYSRYPFRQTVDIRKR